MPRTLICAVACAVAALSAPAEATWSIVIADSETEEVAVGTVTCLTSLDLLGIVPVVVVGKGAAAVQAAGDFDGVRRPIIFARFQQEGPLEQILLQLSGIGGHQSRQYGLAAPYDDAVSFTGSSNGAWAGGTTGSVGTMTYAIQGNVLAGGCVIDAIEAALLEPSLDVPGRLMAGMQAAREAGGDGRCSCSFQNPVACGCPPESFTKSGHIGGMVVARIGDVDDAVCNAAGCADGDYFMRLNVPTQPAGAPDPVEQLQILFDAWRSGLDGRADAIRTHAAFDPPVIPPDGAATTTLRITPRDWQAQPVSVPVTAATVEHAPGSAGLSTIGAPVILPDGTVEIELTAGAAAGEDRFAVTLDDGVRPVVLMPAPRLVYVVTGDLDGDGVVGFGDLLALLAGWGPCGEPCPGDLDGDGMVGFDDLLILLAAWTP